MKNKRVIASVALAAMLVGQVLVPATEVMAEEYTVQSGDTLSDISSATGMTLGEIMEANSITDADKIFVGQVLTLDHVPDSLVNRSKKTTVRSLYELFDAVYYAQQNPDVVAACGTSKSALYNHFVRYGMQEGRDITADFNVAAYRSAYPDLVKAFGNDVSKYYQHYITFGQRENRTLVTVDACKAAGITVTDFSGNTVYAPAAYVEPATYDQSSYDQCEIPDQTEETEYWLTGTWYNTEVTDGPTVSQGPCPYEMYTLIENGDGSLSYYVYISHGAWIDGTFDYNPHNVGQYQAAYDAVVSDCWDYIFANLDYETCTSYTGTDVPIGIYDEGCVHYVTIWPQDHQWADNPSSEGGRYCTSCNLWCDNHVDTDGDNTCDYCGKVMVTE